MLRQKSPDNLDKSFDLVTLNKSNQQGQRTTTGFEVNFIYSYLRMPACDLPGPEPCQPCQSKALSALVSFEQLSLTEPTSSQFAMQLPHGKLWLKSQRQAGRYSSTNGLTLFHWEYTALLGISLARLLLVHGWDSFPPRQVASLCYLSDFANQHPSTWRRKGNGGNVNLKPQHPIHFDVKVLKYWQHVGRQQDLQSKYEWVVLNGSNGSLDVWLSNCGKDMFEQCKDTSWCHKDINHKLTYLIYWYDMI